MGFVYALKNESMPGLVKIGSTVRNPAERSREAGWASCLPTPFQLVGHVELRDAERVEKALHAALDGLRVNPSREFFKMTASAVTGLFGILGAGPVVVGVDAPPVLSRLSQDRVDELLELLRRDGECRQAALQNLWRCKDGPVSALVHRCLEAGLITRRQRGRAYIISLAQS